MSRERALAAAKRLAGRVIINGELLEPKGVSEFEVTDPARGEVIAKMPICGQQEVEKAIQVASASFSSWRSMPATHRGGLLRKAADKLANYEEELAEIMTLETGKAIRTESRLELKSFIEIIRFYAGLGGEIKGETVPLDPNLLTFTIREPLGVVGAIIPWNVPLMLMALKIAPALVAGNTVVVKSSELAPLAVLRAVELMCEVLPKGVLNIISGPGLPTGEVLVKHPLVKKITFTGSVATGRKVYQMAAEKIIPVTLELGGKSPMIIAADADLEKVTSAALAGMRFTRQGQSCSASSRIFVHESIYDNFLDMLTKKLNKLVIGDPFDEKTDAGAIISHEQLNKIKAYIHSAESTSGAKVIRASQIPTDKGLQLGYYTQPHILTGLEHSHQCVQEEIFGPVTCVFKWKDLSKVLELANSTNFGLVANIWTNDLALANRAWRELDAGLVQVNQNLVVKANLPYGGFKNSGMGQEATLEAMLEHYTKRKTVIISS